MTIGSIAGLLMAVIALSQPAPQHSAGTVSETVSPLAPQSAAGQRAVAPPAGAPSAAAAVERQQAALRSLGFSPAGIGAVTQNIQAERAQVGAAGKDLALGRAALIAAAQARPFLEAGFEQLLRAQQARADRLTAQLADRRISLLHSLPLNDQPIYAQALLGAANPSAVAPAAPAPSPSQSATPRR